VPVWHKKTQEWVASGKLVVLGITQEQHPDRCRLFAQWQKFDWPILWDPINVMESTSVPIVIAIDEHGIVRSTRPRPDTIEAEFLNVAFPKDGIGSPAAGADADGQVAKQPDLAALQQIAAQEKTARSYRNFADAAILWGGSTQVDEAIAAYINASKQKPDDAAAMFRSGVAYRVRYDSALRQPDDFRNAVQRWEQALALNPNQYIWRRRIQQYGPRLEKPYSFYDWVEQARPEITARGEVPLPLVVVPQGAELAHPARTFGVVPEAAKSPDPEGRIQRDTNSLILAEITLVPSVVRPGGSTRVHVAMSPNVALQTHWNNEAEPLHVWVEAPEGWRVNQRSHQVAPETNQSTSLEIRRVDFEIQVPADATGTIKLPFYALYFVCEDADGKCQYLRQDLNVEIAVADVGK
jgi:hypothetical protein